MNKYVKRGLEIMRDPATCQAFMQEQQITEHGVCYCAIGCLNLALVEDGIGEFDKGYYAPFDPHAVHAPRFHEWITMQADLFDHRISLGRITLLNDDVRKSLPEIADYIEQQYKETGEGS